MVELLCPVWYLTSTLVAADCLDTLLDKDVPGEDSHQEIKPGVHKDSQRVTMFLNDVNKLFLLQARRLITPYKQLWFTFPCRCI